MASVKGLPASFGVKAILLAVGVHAIIIFAVGVNVIFFESLSSDNTKVGPEVVPVKARAISQEEIEQEMKTLRQVEIAKKREEQEILRKQQLAEEEYRKKQQEIEQIELAKLQEQQRLKEAEEQNRKRQEELRQLEEAKMKEVERLKNVESELAALEQQRQERIEQERRESEEAERRQAEEEKRRQQQEQEQQRIAELNREEQLKQRTLIEQEKAELEELKRKTEQEQAATELKIQQQKQQQIADQKQKELERQRIADQKQKELERQRELAEKKLADQAEQNRIALEQATRRKSISEFSRYVPQIRAKVTQSWNQQGLTQEFELETLVLVEIDQLGSVLDVKIEISSGSKEFDRSVLNAVRKASPLPVPLDPDLYEYFKEFELKFNSQSS